MEFATAQGDSPATDPRAERAARFAALRSADLDVLVIGGGVTGCGIARDAALRGLRVALVEKDDFASGTSSRSSRLIHGGLRYLEHGQLHLVFEASAERRRLLRLAPHLVRPLEFTWPVYSGARVPKWKLAAGLTLYDALALFRNVGTHRRLDAGAVIAREPALCRDGLTGGARYFDAATDDARLTLANAIGAAEAGAIVLNHAVVRSLVARAGRIRGAIVTDTLGAGAVEVRARVLVNAAGPWSDAVARLVETGSGTAAPAREHAAVRGSKGVHIAVPRARIGNRGALTLLAPADGRVMFVLPAGAQAIVGTTDSYTTASPDDVRATAADVEYLLNAANVFFPDARLTRADVVSAWAGIRPLMAGDDGRGDPGSASREHAVAVSEDGLVSITGGKLTTYRVMATDVMRAVLAALGARARRAPTRDAVLPGGDAADLEAVAAAATERLGDIAVARHLAGAFGSRWAGAADEIERPGGAERLVPEAPYTIGELRYCVRREMACTLGDLLVRRTHLAFETTDHGRHAAPRAGAAVAPLLGWSAGDVARAVGDYEREVERIFGIDS